MPTQSGELVGLWRALVPELDALCSMTRSVSAEATKCQCRGDDGTTAWRYAMRGAMQHRTRRLSAGCAMEDKVGPGVDFIAGLEVLPPLQEDVVADASGRCSQSWLGCAHGHMMIFTSVRFCNCGWAIFATLHEVHCLGTGRKIWR
mmetsp:Transcript_142649/g.455310  ORF Transcript_142649/g.455310 Transcript_142649/m.455310 type:complete len:146 (+) Transcript_142649:854-1291(+)